VVEPLWELLTGESVLRVRGYRDAEPRTTFERIEPEPVSEAAG
jgi:hypothetical protein